MNVLFCADGSEVSLRAIDNIPSFLLEHAKINILHVVDTGLLQAVPYLLDDNVLHNSKLVAQNILDETKKHLESNGFKVNSTACSRGNPTDVILAAIAEQNYDVVILGSTKKSVIQSLLGSVSRKIVYKSPIPVLIVHPQKDKTVINLRPNPYILFAIDGSACSYNAITKTCKLFNLGPAYVDILTVKRGAQSLPVEIAMDNVWFERSLAKQQELAEEILESARQILKENNIVVNASHILEGYPADEILTFIEENEPELVVVGSHEREGIADMLLESVSKRVVDNSSAHILMVPNI